MISHEPSARAVENSPLPTPITASTTSKSKRDQRVGRRSMTVVNLPGKARFYKKIPKQLARRMPADLFMGQVLGAEAWRQAVLAGANLPWIGTVSSFVSGLRSWK